MPQFIEFSPIETTIAYLDRPLAQFIEEHRVLLPTVVSPEFIAACPEALPYLDSLITTAFSTPRWTGISVAKITFTSDLLPSHPARAMPVPQHFRMAAEAEYERMIVPYPESDSKTAASVT